jgi:hypothetical protein
LLSVATVSALGARICVDEAMDIAITLLLGEFDITRARFWCEPLQRVG